ncbi:restriction endonuclease subunit S [Aliivibrio sp. S4TY2]|uniref:restriction endonuclease subunit S n=1 Tax=unclassified Aliivibrio TaxID=2645654 RepID=UPI00237998EE|nr:MULTISPECIES: restriction endonuclease subunit S [unclassified Aliivibrio]MDD9156939.1 restriction endonuclease subunit S [Aliivibrio sp. S4TY2]MDD9160847.1 restriction endonuclease subunit S [Aliivibrio sp. S4TY1]MDD9164876.1 restriction endonuclease subunit S [Aliivibrio sp. S4MY2]MDD9168849.1 restriction endonuclease subunit S [Aliivibrio sp. S4MY4]MDD9185377.1 restriction endonuclease subunit S [Aliivibrio sp. S4MY3]
MSEFVPEGWVLLEVQKAFKLGRGRVISKPEIRDNPGHYPVFSSQSKDNGKMGSINTYDFDGEYITWTTDGAYAGTVFHRKGQFNCTNVCGTLQDNGNYDVFPNFVARYLSTVAKSHVSYVGNPKLMNGTFGEIEFLLPPLPEQQKIAAILTSVDEVIEKTQAQINKLKDLKTGMMQELLTRGVGVDGKPHTEFKDSPVGRIPKAWAVELIGNLFSVQLGKMLSKASKITDSPLSYLGNKNIQWGRVVIDDLEKMDFSEKEKQKFSLETGDLLMCEGGDVGRCAIWMNEISDCYYQKAIHRLRPIENRYKPVLLMEYMKFAKENGLLVDYISQTSIAHLTKEKLISIPVPVPSITEQEVIIRVLETLSNRLKAADGKLKKNRNLKKALMQDLLTGKVRVKVDS